MEKKIIKVEEVPEEKKEKFAKAKSIGKTILKVAGGILLSVLAFYGILIANRDILRVTLIK
jgi:hypothetical protein